MRARLHGTKTRSTLEENAYHDHDARARDASTAVVEEPTVSSENFPSVSAMILSGIDSTGSTSTLNEVHWRRDCLHAEQGESSLL
jgi:hypothetical protein